MFNKNCNIEHCILQVTKVISDFDQFTLWNCHLRGNCFDRNLIVVSTS